jgi:hypothetical protein
MAKDYRNKALLYHMTSLSNLESILANGLQSRACLEAAVFEDVADHEILDSRKALGLEQYVPFHFFSKTPFDYGVQRSRPTERFVLLTVRRSYAQAKQWKIIPSHPLGLEAPQMREYEEGYAAIDWDLMETDEKGVTYDTNRAYRQACMAECLSPSVVPSSAFLSIIVKTEEDQRVVETLLKNVGIRLHVNLMLTMFPKDAE